MTDQIVITEKTSQAKDVRAAVGSRYGAVLPAEGHLFDLVEPEEVDPGLEAVVAGPAPSRGPLRHQAGPGWQQGVQAAGHPTALRSAKRVWLATDCDREGQLIGRRSWST
jgi:DNA topoisomerase-3